MTDTLSELPVVVLELSEVVLVALLDGLTGQAVVSSPESSRGPDHDCYEIIDEVFSSRPDLSDQPLPNLEVEYFMDGSSFIQDLRRLASMTE
ncbi:Beta-2 Adrenergic Receptor [Manis pentadactyla]|nr:Beta-2 Adrenergic Receptor [Manis pentadactyla]